MVVNINEQCCLVFKRVYNPIIVTSESGEIVSICERDGRIEIVRRDKVNE